MRSTFGADIVAMGVALMGAVSFAFAQEYPARAIRIAAPEPGGGGDLVSRVIAQGLAGPIGQPVIVENHASAILGELVAKAAPDGYTALLTGQNIWIDPIIRSNVGWDPIRDFAPLTLAASTPLVIVVHPSLGVKSVKDLIALAKSRPGDLNYGSSAVGASSHLGPELFKSMAGVNIVRVPYKSSSTGVNGLMSGEVEMMITNAGAVMPQVKSGRLVALAVTSAQPSALLPMLPTAAATGLPGYEAASVNAMFLPAKTQPAVVHRLNQEIVAVLRQPDARQKLFDAGFESVGSSPEEFAAWMKVDMERWTKVIKSAGIHEQ
jgi:tripartite-type tricarboxylate transporter receptor subunit TctC